MHLRLSVSRVSARWSIDSLIVCLFDGWLFDWLIDWVIDKLIDFWSLDISFQFGGQLFASATRISWNSFGSRLCQYGLSVMKTGIPSCWCWACRSIDWSTDRRADHFIGCWTLDFFAFLLLIDRNSGPFWACSTKQVFDVTCLVYVLAPSGFAAFGWVFSLKWSVKPIDCLYVWLIDWLIGWLSWILFTCLLIDWLTDWLVGCGSYWLALRIQFSWLADLCLFWYRHACHDLRLSTLSALSDARSSKFSRIERVSSRPFVGLRTANPVVPRPLVLCREIVGAFFWNLNLGRDFSTSLARYLVWLFVWLLIGWLFGLISWLIVCYFLLVWLIGWL